MAKEKKRCKECKGMGDECKCPKKGKVGYYGLDIRHKDDDMDNDMPQDTSPMETNEAVKMPKEPGHKQLDGLSNQHKKKKLEAFKAQADEAKKRQRDLDRKGELAHERRTKGIRFYDAKGSGYIRGGKKEYD